MQNLFRDLKRLNGKIYLYFCDIRPFQLTFLAISQFNLTLPPYLFNFLVESFLHFGKNVFSGGAKDKEKLIPAHFCSVKAKLKPEGS